MNDKDGAFVTATYSIVSTLADALRSGWRTGRREISTEYVLRELVRRSALWPGRLRQILPQVWKQAEDMHPDSPDGGPPGMESHDRITLDIQCEAEGVLREAAWHVQREPHRPAGALPVWSDGVRAAVRLALYYARSVEVVSAHYPHLGVGILADPMNRASRFLTEVGFDPALVAESVRATAAFRENADPGLQSTVDLLAMGMLAKRQPLAIRGLAKVLQIRSQRWFGPIMLAIRHEAMRQEIRRGGKYIDHATILMSICSIEHGLRAARIDLRGDLRIANDAARLLSRHGFDYRDAVMCGAQIPLNAGPGDASRRWRVRNVDPSLSVDAVDAIERTARYAAHLGYRWIGSTHLLAALLSYPEGAAIRMLTECGVHIGALMADVAHSLGVEHLDARGD